MIHNHVLQLFWRGVGKGKRAELGSRKHVSELFNTSWVLILVSFAFLNMSVEINLASFSIYAKGGEQVLENVISVALAVCYYSIWQMFKMHARNKTLFITFLLVVFSCFLSLLLLLSFRGLNIVTCKRWEKDNSQERFEQDIETCRFLFVFNS